MQVISQLLAVSEQFNIIPSLGESNESIWPIPVMRVVSTVDQRGTKYERRI